MGIIECQLLPLFDVMLSFLLNLNHESLCVCS